ncbi:hypothetical protein BLOT_015680 [Blomia tropicalis]|nr:hypothetical protein BLOT_015680 [Blomia tropicalis]
MNKEDYFFVHNSRHNKTAIESCLIDKNYQVLSTQVPIQQPTTSTAAIDHIIDDDDSSEIESISSEVEEATNVEKKYNTQMLTSLCIQTISTGCSIRKTTEIISSFILDMKLNNTIDLKPITKSKIESGLKRLKFIKSSQNTFSRTNVKEEHYTLVKQPGDIFVSSVSSKNQVNEILTPARKAAKSIFQEISDLGLEENVRSYLRVNVCDGAPSNTGVKNGIHQAIQEILGRPLHLVVCLFHLNELILKSALKVTESIGSSKSCDIYRGELGELISSDDLHLMDVVDFKQIHTNFSDYQNETGEIRDDQDLLLSLTIGVIKKDNQLLNRVKNYKIGKIGQARWLTTATRILRVYISELNPSEDLIQLTEFVVKIYGPIYFKIRLNPYMSNCSQIFCEIVQRLNEKEGNVFVFSKELREKVFDTLENNSWSVHPRNLLLCMLLDANNEIKEKSIDIIKKSRSLPYSKKLATIKPTRENHFKLNFDAICYHQIIDLDNELNFIEPPLTADIKIEYLNRFVCPKITNHTQIVEYFVQNVNKMSSKYGEDNRNSSIYVKETSKHLKDDQKTEFITKLNKKIQKANTCEKNYVCAFYL